MKSFLKDFIADESGLTAVEYAIAGGLVVGGMVGAFLTLGESATGQINTLACAAEGKSYTAATSTTANDGTVTTTAASCS